MFTIQPGSSDWIAGISWRLGIRGTIHFCTVPLIRLICTGHVPFYMHTNAKRLVDYLESKILEKDARKDASKGQNELLFTKQNSVSVYFLVNVRALDVACRF